MTNWRGKYLRWLHIACGFQKVLALWWKIGRQWPYEPTATDQICYTVQWTHLAVLFLPSGNEGSSVIPIYNRLGRELDPYWLQKLCCPAEIGKCKRSYLYILGIKISALFDLPQTHLVFSFGYIVLSSSLQGYWIIDKILALIDRGSISLTNLFSWLFSLRCMHNKICVKYYFCINMLFFIKAVYFVFLKYILLACVFS